MAFSTRVKMRVFLILILTSLATAWDPPYDNVRYLESFESTPSGHIFSEDLFSNKMPLYEKIKIRSHSLSNFTAFMDNLMDLSYQGVLNVSGFTDHRLLTCPEGRLTIMRKSSPREPYVLIRKGIGTIWMYSDAGIWKFLFRHCSQDETIAWDFGDNRVYWQVTIQRDGASCSPKLERIKIINLSVFGVAIKTVDFDRFPQINDEARAALRHYNEFFEHSIAMRINNLSEGWTSLLNEHVNNVCEAWDI